jgi:hypothetical protein
MLTPVWSIVPNRTIHINFCAQEAGNAECVAARVEYTCALSLLLNIRLPVIQDAVTAVVICTQVGGLLVGCVSGLCTEDTMFALFEAVMQSPHT